jgi:protein phosphatase 2C-like protein
VQLHSASGPAPDRVDPSVNEDLVLTGPDFVVVMDGASAPYGLDSGCKHDVAWLVRRLAAELAVPLVAHSRAPLADILADAIAGVCRQHEATCDLSNPDSPSSTVSIVRAIDDRLDHLVLADSPVVLRTTDGRLDVVLDNRIELLPEYTLETVRRLRNQPGGFWVASTRPKAAYEAISGSTDRSTADLVVLLTDGASRYAERYGHSWTELVELVEHDGPQALIDQVRAADERAPVGSFRGKRRDDATAVLWQVSEAAAGAGNPRTTGTTAGPAAE